MDGRVKTLHPRVHGGILARRGNEGDAAAMEANGILPIDLVVVNLYPFEETVAKDDVTREEAIEQIDIGGPAMLRSAAKNHQSVYVLSSPSQYEETVERLHRDEGRIDPEYGLRLALEVYRTTSTYDAAISAYLATQVELSAPAS